MSHRPHRRPSVGGPLLVATLAALVSLAATACGVGFDDEPRALTEEASTTTVESSPSVGRLTTILYYVREAALVPLEQELPDRSPATLLTALAQPPEVGEDTGLSTSIPAGTELLGTARTGDRLTVDLSSDFDKVVGLARQQAIGQMVLTVTQQGSVERLEFQVEGRTLTVSSPLRGDTTIVGACDFATLLASPDDVSGTELPPSSIAALDARRAQLDSTCEDVAAG